MPFSTGCTTALSNFEAGQNYKDVSDPAVVVAFPLDGDEHGAALVAWTTTPWTLPSNLALCVNPEFTYVKIRDPATGKAFIVAEARMAEIPGAVAKAKKGGGGGGHGGGDKGGKKGKAKAAGDAAVPAAAGDAAPAAAAAPAPAPAAAGGFEVLARMQGSELVGRTYAPLFPYFAGLKASGAFVVCGDAYVTSDSGTGIVHQAPAFGEDDFRVCLAAGVIARGEAVPCPVDESGLFTEPVSDFAGRHVKEADKDIIASVKGMGRLVSSAAIVHSYPFCWRSDTPLIYKAVPSWFVRVEAIKPALLANNAKTRWVPAYVQEKRFHNWLEGARDWAVSRSRFWGTPLPVWVSDDGEEVVVVGSRAELEALTGAPAPGDLHRHFIDHLTIPSRQGRGTLRRVEDVFDCWFESGSMPYAQQHYPFENAERFEATFPADFVAEGLDQTRGWFYTLMVLSTALFDKPAFKNLVCNGLVLAGDGKKMSKRLQNYPDPMEVVGKHGADALRLYLINSPVVRAEPLRFREEGVQGVVREVLLPWYNAYRFLAQNVRRWEADTGRRFDPADPAAAASSNVLDRWVAAAGRSLTRFVGEEMGAYRLYTVVPYLVRFIDGLTNVYVRYNRRRLKGRNGPADTAAALGALYEVLLTLCKVMAPFTPFFAEAIYQNLARALPPGSAPASVHWCDFPEARAEAAGDAQLQASVGRMQGVIDLARQIRERAGRPVKTPLAELIVVHPDAAFLADLTGELAVYVQEELNVRTLTPCADPLRYATLRAEPDWSLLGKRLGRQMAAVGAAVRALPQADILRYDAGEALTVCGDVVLAPGEMRVLRDFRAPEGAAAGQLESAGDGEVLVVADLTEDEALLAAGTAREVVNRVQRLRKSSGLAVTDAVAVFLRTPAGEGGAALWAALGSQRAYVLEAVGCEARPAGEMPAGAEVVASEAHELGGVEFEVVVVRAGGGGGGGGADGAAAALQQQSLAG
jgi:isoleucyl-tRNA synthetase